MAKVILKINPITNVIEDVAEVFPLDIPEDYIEFENEFPPDILCGYYKFDYGNIIQDNKLNNDFVKSQKDSGNHFGQFKK